MAHQTMLETDHQKSVVTNSAIDNKKQTKPDGSEPPYASSGSEPNIKHVEELKHDLAKTTPKDRDNFSLTSKRANNASADKDASANDKVGPMETQDAKNNGDKSFRSQTSHGESHLPSVFDLKENESDVVKASDPKEESHPRAESAFGASQQKLTTKIGSRQEQKQPAQRAKVDIKNLIKVMASK